MEIYIGKASFSEVLLFIMLLIPIIFTISVVTYKYLMHNIDDDPERDNNE